MYKQTNKSQTYYMFYISWINHQEREEKERLFNAVETVSWIALVFILEVRLLSLLGCANHFWRFCLCPSSVVLLYLLSQTHLVAPPKVPAVKKKAEWALKWINATNSSYAERIVAFASVEVIVAFSSLLSSNQLFEIREYFSPAPLPRSSG